MRCQNVLLVYKESFPDLLRAKQAYRAHSRALRQVKGTLKAHGIFFKAVSRVKPYNYAPFDGIITVGGDGTFLAAARHLRPNQWILGVNSDPARSVGHFCTATANTFPCLLARLKNSRVKPIHLYRQTLKLNGKLLDIFLNEILVTHRTPAAMSRYWLKIGPHQEPQNSSGLWIATAAGSTGAVRSAGGRALPITSAQIQYRPRELYRRNGSAYRLTGGVLPPKTPISVGSLMGKGLICVDGEHRTYPFKYGDTVQVQKNPTTLTVIKEKMKGRS